MRLGGLGFLAALAVACGAPGDTRGATWDGQIDTLADGRVVVRNGERGIWPEGAEWQVVEEIRIGTLEGEGPDTFGDVASFEVDNLGRIWVLDMQASELRVFDRDGEYVRTVGRAGSGPGEFRQPVHVDMSPDGRIWVSAPPECPHLDLRYGGQLRREHAGSGAVRRVAVPGGFAGNGLYHVPVVRMDPTFQIDLARFDGMVAPLDTLLAPRDPVEREGCRLVVDGRVVDDAPMPFQGGLVWRLSSSGSVWALITDQYRLFELGDGGDTLRVVTKSFGPIPVTEEERAEALEALRPFVARSGRVDRARIPGHRPTVRSFFLVEDGHLWIERVRLDDRGRTVFDVFAPRWPVPGRRRRPLPAPALSEPDLA